jgi:hypothetical protein
MPPGTWSLTHLCVISLVSETCCEAPKPVQRHCLRVGISCLLRVKLSATPHRWKGASHRSTSMWQALASTTQRASCDMLVASRTGRSRASAVSPTMTASACCAATAVARGTTPSAWASRTRRLTPRRLFVKRASEWLEVYTFPFRICAEPHATPLCLM